jgi:hypothetical protein
MHQKRGERRRGGGCTLKASMAKFLYARPKTNLTPTKPCTDSFFLSPQFSSPRQETLSKSTPSHAVPEHCPDQQRRNRPWTENHFLPGIKTRPIMELLRLLKRINNTCKTLLISLVTSPLQHLLFLIATRTFSVELQESCDM